MQQANVSRAKAVAALRKNSDIVTAIMVRVILLHANTANIRPVYRSFPCKHENKCSEVVKMHRGEKRIIVAFSCHMSQTA